MTREKQGFIYVLKLIPRFIDPEVWTNAEDQIVGRHFARLQELLEDGILILAGKTSGQDERTFGIVVLETGSEGEARAIMESDPAVAQGIMTAELFPYHTALMRGRSS